MNNLSTSNKLTLSDNESNAVFLGVNHVNIFKIRGLEFHHLFLIILIKDPNELGNTFIDRKERFYSSATRNSPDDKVLYFDGVQRLENSFWETTVSASSACGYDSTAKELGNLVTVPNFDRFENNKERKRVFLKKLVVNDLPSIEKILEFENLYNDSLKYALVPEINKDGYNSNSFIRGAMEYAGLVKYLQVPSCYKTPGVSKAVYVADVNSSK